MGRSAPWTGGDPRVGKQTFPVNRGCDRFKKKPGNNPSGKAGPFSQNSAPISDTLPGFH